jgi:glycerol dehydrogenase-like iron-containing ADH family enzyme
MSKKDLEQLYFLEREIEQQERELKKLEAKAMSCGSSVAVTPKSNQTSDKVGDYAVRIADLKTLIESNKEQLLQLESYINAIPESQMRQIMRLKHKENMAWADVALRVGGGNTADSVRMAHDRYLKK